MPPYENPPAAPIEVPPWERAHKTLDQLTEEMRQRASEIEHQQARLAGELDAIRSVLQRISPAAPIAAYPTVNIAPTPIAAYPTVNIAPTRY